MPLHAATSLVAIAPKSACASWSCLPMAPSLNDKDWLRVFFVTVPVAQVVDGGLPVRVGVRFTVPAR